MNNWFGFDPVFSAWVTLIPLSLFVFCLYKEFRRQQKFLVLRIAALTCLFTAVLGIFSKPYLLTGEIPPPAILLTEGYDKTKADSLIKSDVSIKVFTTTGAARYAGASAIDINEVGTIANLRAVLGHGLPVDGLRLLPSSGFLFIPGTSPRGVTQIIIPEKIRPQQLSVIQGHADVGAETFVKLVGPGGPEDSTRVNSNAGDFKLHFRPRQPGLFLYSLVLKNSSMFQSGSVPLEVKEENKLKILFLQKFPTAETRALKNYLTEKGHAVAIRYQVSKTNFNYEFSNLPAQQLTRLTPELLASFDVLFVDNYLFDEIGDGEKGAISKSIKDGLGVIVFVDKFSARDNVINSLLPIKAQKAQADTAHIRLGNNKLYQLPAIPLSIPPIANVQSILQTKTRVLSGYVYSGFGKVGFQLLRETYRIKLEGNSDDYAFIWHDLIERTARMKPVKFKLVLNNTFPYTVNESLLIDVLSDGTQPTLISDKTFVPVEEDVILDDVWHAQIWATDPGWHSIVVKGDSSALNYFVSDTTEWKSLRQVRHQKANLVFSRRALADPGPIDKIKVINPVIWYVLFVLSAGFLWLAPKLRS